MQFYRFICGNYTSSSLCISVDLITHKVCLVRNQVWNHMQDSLVKLEQDQLILECNGTTIMWVGLSKFVHGFSKVLAPKYRHGSFCLLNMSIEIFTLGHSLFPWLFCLSMWFPQHFILHTFYCMPFPRPSHKKWLGRHIPGKMHQKAFCALNHMKMLTPPKNLPALPTQWLIYQFHCAPRDQKAKLLLSTHSGLFWFGLDL